MNKFWNNDINININNENSTQVQTQAGRNNMKKLTLGMIAGVALTVVIGTSAMLSKADDAQASEEFAGRISISSSMPKLVDPSNGVFVDESELLCRGCPTRLEDLVTLVVAAAILAQPGFRNV